MFIIKTQYRNCVVPNVRHLYTGYGIFHCDSIKYDLMLHWITKEYAVFRMKMPHVRDCAISVFCLECDFLINSGLTAHNWQKWKRVFLICPCHKIYRDEAVGLKSCKNTWKLRFLWKCEIWDNIMKIWYFVKNCLIGARIYKFFSTRVTHIIVIV